jgi:hypothetical protein
MECHPVYEIPLESNLMESRRLSFSRKVATALAP